MTSCRSPRSIGRLAPLGHQLDDESLVDLDRERNLGPVRGADERPTYGVLVAVEVARRIGCHLERLTDRDEVPGRGARLDDAPRPDDGAGHVEAPAVHQDVPVRDELAGLAHGLGEPEPEDVDDYNLTTFGRGLDLVAMMSSRWGSDLAHDGRSKSVWFELPV